MADTIHALASARGRAGVAVIRISGPRAEAICEALVGDVPPPRQAALRKIRDAHGALIDEALVLRFAEGHSFTGEPVVELQGHGGPAIVAALLSAIAATGLSRLAEPGEFTRRAFLAGRMDLVQVHGLADAIDAETEAQRIAAMRRTTGDASARFATWRADLLHVAGRLAAAIDFSDEDLPSDVLAEIEGRLIRTRDAIARELSGYEDARALRDGFHVVLLGRPNAGKSSLINAISHRDAAIVTDVPGTTRDALEVPVDLGGLPVILTDTAGLRRTQDVVEAIGIERARDRARDADLRLWLAEADADLDDPEDGVDLYVRTKADLGPTARGDVLPISTVTGAGIDTLRDRIVSILETRVAAAGTINRPFEHQALRSASAHIEVALSLLGHSEEEAAEAVHAALRDLDRLVGKVDVEAVLGEVFSSFCIGK